VISEKRAERKKTSLLLPQERGEGRPSLLARARTKEERGADYLPERKRREKKRNGGNENKEGGGGFFGGGGGGCGGKGRKSQPSRCSLRRRNGRGISICKRKRRRKKKKEDDPSLLVKETSPLIARESASLWKRKGWSTR